MSTNGENLPKLSRALLAAPAFPGDRAIDVVPEHLLDLPERVVQFGTGGFLRGFVDYFLDVANRSGHFDGRVVMVGSTGSGRGNAVNEQDGLYTLVTLGLEDGAEREDYRIVGSVSRALSATDEWDEVLACARSPELELVFSNTTEVGIVFDENDRLDDAPPRSFPGKLARFLLERGRAFDYDPARAPVVIPCELIEENGDRLREIVLALADRWGVEPAFARWIGESVPFCNTLVDRIVPPLRAGDELVERIRAKLGYDDALLTVCEPYRLFAIQADAATAERLRFAAGDPGVVLTDDVTPYRERKVRLLNGSHTLMVPVALLAGCEYVAEALGRPLIREFTRRAALEEVAPTLDVPGATEFAEAVFERFANPFIRHALFDITLQGTMKWRVRLIPPVLRYAGRFGRAPESLAFAFAAYLLFMRGDLQERRRAAGGSVPPDDLGERVRALWSGREEAGDEALAALVREACSAEDLWGVDLTTVPGFAEAATGALVRIVRAGIDEALEEHLNSVVRS